MEQEAVYIERGGREFVFMQGKMASSSNTQDTAMYQETQQVVGGVGREQREMQPQGGSVFAAGGVGGNGGGGGGGGGSSTLYSKQPASGPAEERDLEAQTTTVRSSAPPPAMIAAPVATTTTVATPPVRRTDVRPQPREEDHSKTGGLLRSFITKSTGPFFFSLMAAIAFFSFLVLVSSAQIENVATTTVAFIGYALLIAQVSFAVALGGAVMERLGLLEHISIRIALAAFLMILWVPALVILTFFGIFASPLFTANGFFGVWGALIASTILFVHEADRARKRRAHYSSAPTASLLVIFFSSLMVMGAGIALYSQHSTAQGWTGGLVNPLNYVSFAIAFGAITAFLSIVFLIIFAGVGAKMMVTLGAIFWVWVALGVMFLTFANPFEFALGNGYYASLFTLLASFGLLVALKQRSDDENCQSATDLAAERSARRFFNFMRVMTFASLVVMIAASLVCRDFGGCSGNIQRFQVAAGAVSLAIGLVVCLLEAFGAYRVGGTIKIAIALLLMLWWVGSFVVLTYFGTFQSPSRPQAFYANGFFFTWVALIAASLAFAEALKERSLEADPPNPFIAKIGFLLLIIIGSAIVLGSAIDWYYRLGYTPMTAYALSVGPVSILVVLITYCCTGATYNKGEAHDALHNAGMYFLTIWWALALLILTFNGFWTAATHNGYFGLFFTLGACLLAISGIWRHDDLEDDVECRREEPPVVRQEARGTEYRELRGGGAPGSGPSASTATYGQQNTTNTAASEQRDLYRS